MSNNDVLAFLSDASKSPDYNFRLFLKTTFGELFYLGLMQHGSEPYIKFAGKSCLTTDSWAIDFKEHGHNFTIMQVAEGWRLDILYKDKTFDGQVVEVPEDSTPEEMILVFHSLKAEMIVELNQHLASLEFQTQLRSERNREIAPPDPELLLPSTLIRLADWECQLILEFVRSGCEPKAAISKAKALVWMQINNDGYAPGDLSLIDKCKSSTKAKEPPEYGGRYFVKFIDKGNIYRTTACYSPGLGWSDPTGDIDIQAKFWGSQIIDWAQKDFDQN